MGNDSIECTKSGFPRLSGDFNRGYTKAIRDIMEVFGYIQDDLEHHHKKITAKNSMELLKCCLENRENLRDEVGGGFIRYSNRIPGFEYYIPKRKDKAK